MKVVYLGGANEVGASSIFLHIGGHNILLDAGIRQGKSKDPLPDYSQVKDLGGIDAIVVSHAHMDHIGSLPIISKEYPRASIYMTKMTLDLARVLLYDSLKIMNYNEGEIPMFNEQEVLNMLDRVRVIPFEQEYSLFDDLKVTFYMAGHIAGAAATYLKSKEGTCFYTGDFSLTNALTISGMSIPKLRPDVVISETTYGDKLHANREAEEIRLVEKVREITSQGGKALIPVFALGRSQEVTLILKRAFTKKTLPSVPVYIDGMVQNIMRVFQDNPLFLRENLAKKILKEKEIFYDDNVLKVEDDAMRQKIVESNDPSIIVASSGMLIGGRSEFYASYIVQSDKNGIILTGYQDEESNGRMLLDLMNEEKEKRKLKLAGKVYDIQAAIDIVGLSAHADKQEIKNLLAMLSPKKVILGHGEKSVISSFATELTSEQNVDVYVPGVGEAIELEIKNPRKQIDKKLNVLYAQEGEVEDFYQFIKDNYGTHLFTKEDLAYIYCGAEPSQEDVDNLTKKMIASPYFTQDHKRYFLFKVADEDDILKETDKEITNQELEQLATLLLKNFPYKKISYYREEKKVMVTFDFPKVIDADFDEICTQFQEKTGFQLLKNDNINNVACEAVIRDLIGPATIDKISYLPLEDSFKVKTYETVPEETILRIKSKIGYDVSVVVVAKPQNTLTRTHAKTGDKMEQNVAIGYIKEYFDSKQDAPYKISLKNGGLVLSFITYEIASKYRSDFETLESDTGYEIEVNKSANMAMIFNELNTLLGKYNLEKTKNPSYLPTQNKVSIKLPSIDENVKKLLENDFLEKTGLSLLIDAH